MIYHPLKDRLNDFLLQHVGEDRPAYLDIDETHAELNDLTEHFDLIRDEWDTFETSRTALRRAADRSPFSLVQSGRAVEESRALFPLTCRLLHDVPDVVQASFSVLEPGTNIPCRRGPSLGYLRYELGIKIPRQNPPTLVVDKQSYVWREGEAVMFDESQAHMVINRARERRVVLSVDVLRELPWHLSAINRAMIFGLAKPASYLKAPRRSEPVAALASH
jgi:aspartate beta-hydroxylase/beta-hydroxylase